MTRRTRWSRVMCLVGLALALFGCTRLPALHDGPQGGAGLEPLRGPGFEFVDGKARVFIGFRGLPGPAEEALVRGVGGEVVATYTIVPAIAARLPEAAIPALSRNPAVAYIEPDGLAQVFDLELDSTWGVKRIGAGAVHASGNTGSGIKVAILDTGIDYTHPDLAPNYRGGYDFVTNDPDPMDDRGHGTHVAGTVAALWNGVGVVGAAPEVELYSVKVLGSDGFGYWSWIIAGINWAVTNGMRVINMSLGGDPSTTLETACNNAYAAGVLLVAAAGNTGEGTDTVRAPARYASVIAVGATNSRDERTSFSATGPGLELAAPGESIRSTLLGGGYGTKSGTSMASPHVAGAAALVWAANPTWTNAQVRQRLLATAQDLGAAGWDPYYGHGLVRADLAAAGATPPPPPTGTLVVKKTVVGTAPTTDWTFTGTSPLGTFALPPSGGSRTFSGIPVGEYTITETVKADYAVTVFVNGVAVGDRSSATVNLAQNATVTVEFVNTYVPPAPIRMFVSSVEMQVVPQNRNFSCATATVTVVDTGGAPVVGAVVSGSWSGAVSGTASGTTGLQGKVTFRSATARQPIRLPFTFCVTGVVKSGFEYSPELNGATCGTITAP